MPHMYNVHARQSTSRPQMYYKRANDSNRHQHQASSMFNIAARAACYEARPQPGYRATAGPQRGRCSTSSGLVQVPSQTRTPFSGSRISAAYLPHGRLRTPL